MYSQIRNKYSQKTRVHAQSSTILKKLCLMAYKRDPMPRVNMMVCSRKQKIGFMTAIVCHWC